MTARMLTAAEVRAERIRAIVDQAPAFSDDQRHKIAALLRTPEAQSRASRVA